MLRFSATDSNFLLDVSDQFSYHPLTMSDLVSVALCTYNGEQYLEELLVSLENQTYENIEFVVCDDCSSDQTIKIIKNFSKNKKNWKIFRNSKNLGYRKNFEKCISLCRGSYIALCDQDDIWDKNKIQILKSNIGEALLIHSDARLIDSKGQQLANSYSNIANKNVKDNSLEKMIFRNSVTGCTSMISKKILQKALPFPNELNHDHWLALIAAREGYIKYLPDVLISYRQHEGNQIGAQKHLDKRKIKNYRIDFHTNRLFYYKQLTIVLEKRSFCISSLRFVKQMMDYHRLLISKNISFKPIYIYIKYWRYFTYNKTIFQSLKTALASFKGVDC